MKRNKMVVLVIVFLIILIIGGSYAWLAITKTSTKSNVITAVKLDLTLYATNLLHSNYINFLC